jgi:GNAT superfamily N-acetyltransferase
MDGRSDLQAADNNDSREIRDVGINMVRDDLEDLPRFELPAGYSIRPWREGDRHTWTDLQRAAEMWLEITDDLYVTEFGSDTDELARRQLFLCNSSGEAVGTATAWCGKIDGERLGQVHWVAIRPQEQGRGLSRPLLSATCELLRELGHRRTFLTTSTARLAALRLYLRFGFRPDPVNAAQRTAWAALHLT